ncbi:MAG: hypothetical protein KF752_01175 [Pirellulaceae bacterium]|nr:hypothetical protein [Pirellulaceae bacterium]
MRLTGGTRILRLSLVIVAVFSASVSPEVLAQNYLFSVPQMDVQAFVQPDASILLKYKILFENSRGGHAVDVVDIGLPHADYKLSNMLASVDGVQLKSIGRSTYIPIGVEVHLGASAIPPGGSGVFEFQCTMPNMVYRDSTDKSYASLQIIPTWFDPNSQQGRTRLQVAIHMLPGVKAEEVKYQAENYKYTDLVLFGEGNEKHPVAVWQYDSIQLSPKNPKCSVSFPQIGMQRVVAIGPFGLMMKWFREHPSAQWTSFIGSAILLAIIFFRFSHGTGFVLFFMLVGMLGLAASISPALNLAAWPFLGLAYWLNERLLKKRRKKMDYLPAMATVEGGGIKRGLTAPQAAVLLELPLGKVLTLVLFGLIRKEVLQKTSDDPLQVDVDVAFRVDRKRRLQVAGQRGIVLHDYEHAFLDQLQAHQGPVKKCDLNEAMGGLFKSVASRMAGFDLQETQAYYRAIIERASKEAESVGQAELRDEVLDRNHEWILLDDNWIDVFERWARRGYRYRPPWERRRTGPIIIMDGGAWRGPAGGIPSTGSGIPGGGAPSLGTPDTSRTSLGEVASSFAGWAENTMAGLASAVEPVKMGLNVPSGGVVDLSGVDRVTADVFKALAEHSASSGGGRRGGGGGCACACAGCACACACAGGGR